jgi:hypothetical protein
MTQDRQVENVTGHGELFDGSVSSCNISYVPGTGTVPVPTVIAALMIRPAKFGVWIMSQDFVSSSYSLQYCTVMI